MLLLLHFLLHASNSPLHQHRPLLSRTQETEIWWFQTLNWNEVGIGFSAAILVALLTVKFFFCAVLWRTRQAKKAW